MKSTLPVVQQLSMSLVCSIGTQQQTIAKRGEPVPLKRETKIVVKDEIEIRHIDILTEEQTVLTSYGRKIVFIIGWN